MNHFNVIAIDLAKNSFQVCKTDHRGHVIFNRSMSRQKLKELLIKEKQSLVAMESCGGTHYWAQYAVKHGHKVKAMSARHVKAFRQGQKTDANDALAISIACLQPNIKPCRLLKVEEQCEQGVMRIRELLIEQRIQISNQLQTLMLEFGLPVAKGDKALRETISLALEDAENSFSFYFRFSLNQLYERYKSLDDQVDELQTQLNAMTKNDRICKRLQALEGVGPVCAMLLKIALNQVGHFSKGRDAAACIGVTPVQHSTGGKQKIGSISKYSAHNTLRSALYQGSLSVVSKIEKKEAHTHKDVWLKELVARRGMKRAAIALANKTVRTAFALIAKDENYQPQLLEA